MTGEAREIRFPIRVEVRTDVDYRALAAVAEAEGYEHVADYVQAVVDRLAAVKVPEDAVLRLHAQGCTTRQIAEDTGLTINAIRGRLSSAGLRSNRAPKAAS